MNIFCLFAEINKQICGPLLVMEKIIYILRYCSSNLTIFHVQISFLSARQQPVIQENCLYVFLFQSNVYETKYMILKLQLLTSISVEFGRKGPFNKQTARLWRDQVSEKLMSQPGDHFFNRCSRRQMRDFKEYHRRQIFISVSSWKKTYSDLFL